jgi:hypothetical protein
MSEIVQCPFCGGTDSEDNATQQAALYCVQVKAATGQRAYQVQCNCGAKGSIELHHLNALAKWNHRVPIPTEPVERKAIEAAES